MKRLNFIVAVVVSFVLGSVMHSCEKKGNVIDVHAGKTGSFSGVLGHFNHSTREFVLGMSEDSLAMIVELGILGECHHQISVEDIEIIDEHPSDTGYVSNLKVVLFSVDSGTTHTMYYELSKAIDGDGDVLYSAKPPKDQQWFVVCESEQCGQGECVGVFNEKGRVIDCTNCRERCRKTMVYSDGGVRGEGADWYRVIGLIIDAIAAAGPYIK